MTSARETASRFRYRGARRDGTIEFGVLDAVTREGVVAALAARGIIPVEIQLLSQEREVRSKLNLPDLALGLRVLASLLEAGLPIAKALSMFTELAPASWRAGLVTIRPAIQEGRALAAALDASPLRIPPVLVGIIRAGEAAGRLSASVRSAAELAERQAAARAALYASLTYPAVLALAAVGSIGLLVGVVVPRFAKILADIGGTLPASTATVVSVAQTAKSALVPVAVFSAAAFGLWKAWVATDAGLVRWHGWLLTIPGLGAVRQCNGTSRFCAALAALLENGVPLAPALVHAGAAAGDEALRVATQNARASVIEGQPLSRALEAHRAATLTAIRLVRAGEESGNVPAMLQHAALVERERSERAVKSALQLLEPAMILLLGGVVAAIAAALLQALYSMKPAS
jgi:general secretion pathway protein F